MGQFIYSWYVLFSFVLESTNFGYFFYIEEEIILYGENVTIDTYLENWY